MSGRGRARANANIALSKYWGKLDVARNLPAVPSLSLTLAELVTETEVVCSPALGEDRFELDGRAASPNERARVVRVLDAMRARAGATERAYVRSSNRFPTASGLASSASGFAALVGASARAYGLTQTPEALSALARAASASAARSVFGGFVELAAGVPGDDGLAATPLHPPDHWDVRLVVAVVDEGRKDTASTEGMERSRRTSPLHAAFVAHAPGLHATVRAGVAARDLPRVGEAMEQSTFAFHGAAMASSPPILYFRPATIAALATVRALRDDGVAAYATMDAGPHVKVLCEAEHADRVRWSLERAEGVRRTLVAAPGGGLEHDAW